ncbi:DUF6888 family protein [Microseira wollei]
MPTAEQMLSCFILSYWATKMYLPIFIIRLDERTGDMFFLAGEETEIIIPPNGRWRYAL